MIRAHDSEDEMAKEVYARFGLAIYHSQCLERQLAILLASKYGPGPQRITRKQYDALLDSLFHKTFGQLITQLRAVVAISDEFEGPLKSALELRNWLTHHYFWDRTEEIVSVEGMAKMIHELKNAADLLLKVDQQLETVTLDWGRQHGITDDEFNAIYRRLEIEDSDGI